MSIAELINAIGMFLYFAILARVILSWFPMGRRYNNPLVQIIHAVTEPILAPIRRVVPTAGIFDFTPMIAIIVVAFVTQVLANLLG